MSDHWTNADLYHDWTSPDGEFHAQTQYDHSEGNRTYLAYRFFHWDVLVFEGEDFGCSPMHGDDSWASLAGLLHFLALRPGDTDREYFKAYTEEQMTFALHHGEALWSWAESMERWDEAPFHGVPRRDARGLLP